MWTAGFLTFCAEALLAVLASASADTAEPIQAGDLVVTVREAPLQTAKEIVAIIPKGSELTVGGVRGDWVGVEFAADGKKTRGWVHRSHLARVAPSPPPTTVRQPDATAAQEEVQLLGTYAERTPGFAFSDNGRHAIIGISKDGQCHYEYDGKAGRTFQGASRPLLSEDGEHYVYGGRREGGWWVITDQAEYGPYVNIGGCNAPSVGLSRSSLTFCQALLCTFSSDGKRLGFAVGDGTNWLLFQDGKPLGTFSSVGINSLGFDPAGRRFVYWAESNGKWYLFLDGKAQEPASDDLVESWCVFSPDGAHALWPVQQGQRKLLVQDGKVVAEGTQVQEPIYSADGSRWLAVVVQEGKSRLVENGQEVGTYPSVVDGPVFSPDGKHTALMVKQDDGTVAVVRDGQAGQAYAEGGGFSAEWVFMGRSPPMLRFSGDGRLAYPMKNAEGTFVVVDDSVYGPYEEAVTLRFSRDGHRCGFVVGKGKRDDSANPERRAIVLDGKQGPWYEATICPVFSPDGQHCAYAFKQGGRWSVVLDDQTQGADYEDVDSLDFTPAGLLVAVVKASANKVSVLVDGVPGRTWDAVSPIHSPNFDQQGNLHYLAVSEGQLHRVTRMLP